MSDIADRIARVLRAHGVGDECLVDWTRADRLAAAVVEELGLRPHYSDDGWVMWYQTRPQTLTPYSPGPLI